VAAFAASASVDVTSELNPLLSKKIIKQTASKDYGVLSVAVLLSIANSENFLASFSKDFRAVSESVESAVDVGVRAVTGSTLASRYTPEGETLADGFAQSLLNTVQMFRYLSNVERSHASNIRSSTRSALVYGNRLAAVLAAQGLTRQASNLNQRLAEAVKASKGMTDAVKRDLNIIVKHANKVARNVRAAQGELRSSPAKAMQGLVDASAQLRELAADLSRLESDAVASSAALGDKLVFLMERANAALDAAVPSHAQCPAETVPLSIEAEMKAFVTAKISNAILGQPAPKLKIAPSPVKFVSPAVRRNIERSKREYRVDMAAHKIVKTASKAAGKHALPRHHHESDEYGLNALGRKFDVMLEKKMLLEQAGPAKNKRSKRPSAPTAKKPAAKKPAAKKATTNKAAPKKSGGRAKAASSAQQQLSSLQGTKKAVQNAKLRAGVQTMAASARNAKNVGRLGRLAQKAGPKAMGAANKFAKTLDTPSGKVAAQATEAMANPDKFVQQFPACAWRPGMKPPGQKTFLEVMADAAAPAQCAQQVAQKQTFAQRHPFLMAGASMVANFLPPPAGLLVKTGIAVAKNPQAAKDCINGGGCGKLGKGVAAEIIPGAGMVMKAVDDSKGADGKIDKSKLAGTLAANGAAMATGAVVGSIVGSAAAPITNLVSGAAQQALGQAAGGVVGGFVNGKITGAIAGKINEKVMPITTSAASNAASSAVKAMTSDVKKTNALPARYSTFTIDQLKVREANGKSKGYNMLPKPGTKEALSEALDLAIGTRPPSMTEAQFKAYFSQGYADYLKPQ